MEAATMERREVEMAESSGIGLDDFMARIDERFDRAEEKADERFDRFDERFDRAEEKIYERFDRADEKVDERFVEVDRRFGEVNRRLDQADGQLARVNDRLDSLTRVMIAAIVTFTGSVLAGFAAILVLIATQV